MLICELFNSAVPYQSEGPGRYVFDITGTKYQVEADDMGEGAITFNFGVIDGKKGLVITATNTGNEFAVFSTVMAILAKEIQNGVSNVMFTASLGEPSRVKLYDRFMSLVQKRLPGWRFDVEDDDDERQYFIKKAKVS